MSKNHSEIGSASVGNPPPDGAGEVESPDAHALRNHLAIILGFSDLLISEMAEDHPRRADLMAIHTAARDAMALVARLWTRS